ncbi:MAG: DNA polymerase III subunit epsilon [Methylomonas sp.]|nr:DNA polymerase III subunit epsilon [Methylomonas sp.]PPD20776.1 MAG: DNA polymerase III subunit epsilon [Methylomonas sp.]PPD27301.1 MAG: DNA polymerase III subunit epsilon [Methylomonas sp.]PPD39272.1 MAG: DNA polymerase III subunit epsilon [Methylomonas sp.]PPD40730.1 MAG: DNA polymerase III subunit epsilon [Methylomonas sp.]
MQASTPTRQIVLDTETTGINPKEGHKIIEIGCVELVERRLTHNRFHVYLNPDRAIDAGAIEVHGITNEFLSDKPRFADVARDFVEFVKGAELIIHNAAFDVGFLNHELSSLNAALADSVESICTVFDTLAFARKKHPGARNNLDALCKRYGIDNSHRELHGALLDAEILADVYLIMTGGQSSLIEEHETAVVEDRRPLAKTASNRPGLKVILCNEEETLQHQQRLNNMGNSLWQKASV